MAIGRRHDGKMTWQIEQLAVRWIPDFSWCCGRKRDKKGLVLSATIDVVIEKNPRTTHCLASRCL